MMKKKILMLSAILLVNFSFAQEIKMDDFSTIIIKDSQVLDEQAKPDFVQESVEPTVELPQIDSDLPDLEDESSVKKRVSESEEVLYFEGTVIGGWPGIFAGDFALSRSQDNNYFSCDFTHNSVKGYGLNKSFDGFFNDDTELKFDGSNKLTQNTDLIYSGNYQTQQFGLQGISSKFYSTQLRSGALNAHADFEVSKNFSLFGDVDSNLSNWYASFLGENASGEKSSLTRFGVSPKAGFTANSGIFECMFFTQYDFDMAQGLSSFYANRVLLDYNMKFSFEPYSILAKVEYVYAQNKSIVPFEIDFDYSGTFEIFVAGGLKSQKAQIYEFQKEYLVYNDYACSEQTDWFANGLAKFWILDFIENTVQLEFASTAFGNGMLVGDYSVLDSETGLYLTQNFCGNRLNSEYQFDFNFSSSSISLLWQAWWLDYPVAVCPQNIRLEYAYAQNEGKWGVSVWTNGGFGGNREVLGDLVPDIGMNAFLRVGKTFKFAFELTDSAKLFSGTNRTYYGSYIKQSGSASILLSFYL